MWKKNGTLEIGPLFLKGICIGGDTEWTVEIQGNESIWDDLVLILGAPLWTYHALSLQPLSRFFIPMAEMNALTPSLNLRHPKPKSIEYI